jgi:hypothetical protein
MTPYEIVKATAIVLILAVIGLLVGHALPLIDEFRQDGATIAQNVESVSKATETALKSIQAIETNTTRTEAEMAGLLSASRHAMLTKDQVAALVAHVTKTLEDADASVNRFNNQTLPDFGKLLSSGSDLVAHADAETGEMATQFRGFLSAGTGAVESIGSDANAAHAAIEPLAGTAQNVEATTADVRKIADEWAAPIKGVWAHLKQFLFAIAGPAANVANAIK